MGHAQRGFSLLEMIAAIMILAVALTALLMLAGRSRQLHQQAVAQIGRIQEARSLLDASFAAGPARAGISQGLLQEGGYWRLQTTLLADRASAAGIRLYRLDLQLTWRAAGQARHQRFHTLRIARVPASESLP